MIRILQEKQNFLPVILHDLLFRNNLYFDLPLLSLTLGQFNEVHPAESENCVFDRLQGTRLVVCYDFLLVHRFDLPLDHVVELVI